MILKAFLAGVLACLVAALGAAAFVFHGWWTFHENERSIVERMDQYYLSLTAPAREQYLLPDDETFEVPYMASKLSVAAEPTRIYDANERLMGEFSVDKAQVVRDPADLPLFLKRALIASEDGTFYQHHGINWLATARAFVTDLRHMRVVQGGSTITQQLAKMMFTTRKKTFGRKVYELFCARKLEEKFTKDQILLMYLNFAYFGHGCFGVESAARYYFGKSTRELELPEAAMLVAIIPNPRRYSPFENLDLAKARERTVLSRMAKLGFVPDRSIDKIADDFWHKMEARSKTRDREISFWRMRVNEAPYPIEYLRRELLKSFTKEQLLKGGLRIHTTFDLDYQKAAEKAVRDVLREQNADESAASPIEGSMVALRPSDDAILAMVGGSAFDFQNQLNRAVDSRRLIGSAVKPFIYADAFETGKHKPDDVMDDHPLHFSLPGGRTWSPRNYGNKYHGLVDLHYALADSMNSVAIQILQQLDLSEVIGRLSAASGVPVERFPRNLTLALGTVDMSALELSRAYATFVNDGRSAQPYAIRYIEDRDGKVLEDFRTRPEPAVVFSTTTCAQALDLMEGVLKPKGTAYAAARRTGFNIPAAGKTGTTNDYRDAWFAGVTPDLAAAVWMGHDDMRVPLGEGKAGGAISAPAWMNFVKSVYRNRPTREFAFQAQPAGK